MQNLTGYPSLLPSWGGFRTLFFYMNIKQTAFFLAVSVLFTLTGYSEPAVAAAAGNGSGDPWNRAVALRDQGDLSAARKQFERFLQQWPGDRRAPAAKQAIGDIYFEQGKDRKAFEAYEELIQNYYTGLKDYDSVLNNQYEIARREVNRKRMAWMFGGYTSPERAIPYLESILQNAPQWSRAPEMQFQIGEAYRKNENYPEAVAAYTTVEYRYPDSPFTEQAAFAKVQCLKEMVCSTPYSDAFREQAAAAAANFAAVYPESEQLDAVNSFSAELAEMAAQRDFEIAAFYERVPETTKKNAARIYYEKVIREHSGTDYAARAEDRLRALFSSDDAAKGEIDLLAGKKKVYPERGPLPERMTEDKEAVEMTADRMEYEGNVLVGEGNVAVQQQGASLQADRVAVNPDTGEITASGNVLMFHEDTKWEGEKLVYNFKTKEGDFGKSDIVFESAYISAERTVRVSTNTFMMYNATITTCEGDDPLVYAKAETVEVMDEDKPSGLFIKARKVTFYMGDVPVFYTPYWHRHLGYRVFTFTVGHSGRLGAFFKGRWELHPAEGYISNTHLDYFHERGVGIGQELKWHKNDKNLLKKEKEKAEKEGAGEDGEEEDEEGEEPDWGTMGRVLAYHINDSNPQESTDTPAEEAQVDSSRFRISASHDHEFSDSLYFMGELNYLSDPFVLEDFFHEEFRRYANPENYAVLQYSTNHYAASLRVDRRLNDFYTTINRMPAADYDWYLNRIGESKYFFESENSLSFLEKQHSGFDQRRDANPDAMDPVERITPPDYRSLRLDTYNPVYMPMRYKEYLNVIPRAAYRGTWYSDTKDGGMGLRNIFEFGTLTSYKAHKILTEENGWWGSGLRNVVEPYADYLYRFEPNLRPDELHWFDEVDQLDAANEVRFGVRNFLQTKRGEKRITNFLESDVFTSLRFDPLEDENTLGPLEAEVDLRLTDNFYIQSDLEFEWEEGEFRDYNIRGTYRAEDHSYYSLSYRFLNDEYSIFTPHVWLFPEEKWSYQFYAQYDSMMGKFRDREILVNRRFDCVTLGTGLRVDDDNEITIYLQFWLTGHPGLGIGSGAGRGR